MQPNQQFPPMQYGQQPMQYGQPQQYPAMGGGMQPQPQYGQQAMQQFPAAATTPPTPEVTDADPSGGGLRPSLQHLIGRALVIVPLSIMANVPSSFVADQDGRRQFGDVLVADIWVLDGGQLRWGSNPRQGKMQDTHGMPTVPALFRGVWIRQVVLVDRLRNSIGVAKLGRLAMNGRAYAFNPLGDSAPDQAARQIQAQVWAAGPYALANPPIYDLITGQVIDPNAPTATPPTQQFQPAPQMQNHPIQPAQQMPMQQFAPQQVPQVVYGAPSPQQQLQQQMPTAAPAPAAQTAPAGVQLPPHLAAKGWTADQFALLPPPVQQQLAGQP